MKRLFADHLFDRICIYNRNEWNQAQLRYLLKDDPRMRWMIGDVRDRDRLRRAMEGVDVVIHAAALKRIETVDYNPLEAVATNVTGTENVINAAIDAGVKKAVLLSSDKACNPSTMYGMTKAVAERLFQNAHLYAGPNRTEFVICRYGNVAGSTGSVVPIWRRLLSEGMTELPITHMQATRFWMRIDQAIDMVIHAVLNGKSGELMTPDLPAFLLMQLGQVLGATGFRMIPMGQGEKVHEEMRPGESSADARKLTVEELKEALAHV